MRVLRFSPLPICKTPRTPKWHSVRGAICVSNPFRPTPERRTRPKMTNAPKFTYYVSRRKHVSKTHPLKFYAAFAGGSFPLATSATRLRNFLHSLIGRPPGPPGPSTPVNEITLASNPGLNQANVHRSNTDSSQEELLDPATHESRLRAAKSHAVIAFQDCVSSHA